jgi:hypothetical protein
MKRHGTDLLSLGFGLVFVSVAAYWMFRNLTSFNLSAGWLAIGVLTAVGVIGLVTVSRRTVQPEPVVSPLDDDLLLPGTGDAEPDQVARP